MASIRRWSPRHHTDIVNTHGELTGTTLTIFPCGLLTPLTVPWHNHTSRGRDPATVPLGGGTICPTGSKASIMATITNARRKALELTPAERVRLADMVGEALDRLGFNIPAAARATTLSTAAIRMRLNDKGDGEGSRIFLYAWVALCDGLGLDPAEVAESMGVTIEPADLATATHSLAVRRRRMGSDGAAPARRRLAANPAPGVDDTDELGRLINEIAERRIAEAIESRVDEAVKRRLGLGA